MYPNRLKVAMISCVLRIFSIELANFLTIACMHHAEGVKYIIDSNIDNKKNISEVRHLEKEKLEEIMKEYEEDPDNFYQKNAFVLWDEGKN